MVGLHCTKSCSVMAHDLSLDIEDPLVRLIELIANHEQGEEQGQWHHQDS